jgi:antirestriction protein
VLDWAYHIIEEMGYLDNVPEQLIYYFDYKAYARDAEIQDIFTVPSKDGVYVLLNN